MGVVSDNAIKTDGREGGETEKGTGRLDGREEGRKAGWRGRKDRGMEERMKERKEERQTEGGKARESRADIKTAGGGRGRRTEQQLMY